MLMVAVGEKLGKAERPTNVEKRKVTPLVASSRLLLPVAHTPRKTDLLQRILSKTTSCFDARRSAKANGDLESSTFRSFPMSAFLSPSSCL